jgi:hypothetical protein
MAELMDDLARWNGRELLDANAKKIGTIAGPAFPRRKFGTSWLAVEVDGARIPVPLIGIRSSGDRLVLPYPKTYVQSGPAIVDDQPLSEAEVRRMGLHYGFDRGLGDPSCCRTCGLCSSARKARRSN